MSAERDLPASTKEPRKRSFGKLTFKYELRTMYDVPPLASIPSFTSLALKTFRATMYYL